MTSKQQLPSADSNPEHSSSNGSRLRVFLLELSKRKVCRTAISYMLVMWLNLQIGDVIFPMIGAPEWALNLIIVIGVMGFPVVLILAWAFQVTAAGIMLDQGAESAHPKKDRSDALLDLLLLMTAITLSVLMLLQIHSAASMSTMLATDLEEDSRTVVSSLSIQSTSEEPDSQTIAAGIQAELRHRLINLTELEVLPELPHVTPASSSRSLALSGSLLVDDGSAHVLAQLIDLSAGRYLMSVTFDVNSESTLDMEIAATERIICEVNRTLNGGADCAVQAATAWRQRC